MALYDSTAFAPKLVAGGSSLSFNADPRINILSKSITKNQQISQYNIPAQDGCKILGAQKLGQTIELELEIATTSLSAYLTYLNLIRTILEGGSDGKFDFYLRYEDANNYWCYTNCQCSDFSSFDGPHDANNISLENTLSLVFLSEDADPTIVSGGTILSGDTDETQSDDTIIGATQIIISDELIVQNSSGDIKFRVSAVTGLMEIVGTIDQDL